MFELLAFFFLFLSVFVSQFSRSEQLSLRVDWMEACSLVCCEARGALLFTGFQTQSDQTRKNVPKIFTLIKIIK
jgi:hypothetical protein